MGRRACPTPTPWGPLNDIGLREVGFGMCIAGVVFLPVGFYADAVEWIVLGIGMVVGGLALVLFANMHDETQDR